MYEVWLKALGFAAAAVERAATAERAAAVTLI